MRYFLQFAVMLGDILILGACGVLWHEVGKESPIFCLIMTVIAFKVHQSTGGFIAWTPSGIRDFFRNAKRMGL